MLSNELFSTRDLDHKESQTIAELGHWLRFIRDRRWSRRQKYALIMHFHDIQSAASAKVSDVHHFLNGGPKSTSADVDEHQVQTELAWLQHKDHHLICRLDPRYPELLKHIDDPPIALFAIGDLTLLEKSKVAIVGSRRPTPTGERVTAEISGGLSSLGIAVVSGMALGIDGAAHQAALEVQGPTIAVVGSGIDVVYPRRHTELYTSLSSHGLILSEYPFGRRPSKYTFPDRNRLVSGLSLGVVIVEAAERSGTLITARLAIEQNRELMVVPGAALSHQYRGSHRLIRDGANLVCSADDVLTHLSGELSANLILSAKYDEASQDVPSPLAGLSDQQSRVVMCIDFSSTSVDAVVERTGLSPAELFGVLLELEMQGVVATTREGGYIRVA